MTDKIIIGGREFGSRLFGGTGQFHAPPKMLVALVASGPVRVSGGL